MFRVAFFTTISLGLTETFPYDMVRRSLEQTPLESGEYLIYDGSN